MTLFASVPLDSPREKHIYFVSVFCNTIMDPRRKACIAIILALGTKRNVKRQRWMKNWLQKREKYSHVVLLKEIGMTESEDYRNYFRMSVGTFDKLLRMVEPFLIRKDTNMRESLSVNERLAVTLRYLATGRNFEDLKFSAVMSPAAISVAVVETCEVLIYVLQEYVKVSPRVYNCFVSMICLLYKLKFKCSRVYLKHIN